MTRKDYLKAAQMIQCLESGADRVTVAAFLVRLFRDDNPRFDADIFLGASGFADVAEFRKATGL